MREFMFEAQIPEKMLGSFSALTSYMPRIHSNYYIHTQMLLYYFFVEMVPAIASLNTNDIMTGLVH